MSFFQSTVGRSFTANLISISSIVILWEISLGDDTLVNPTSNFAYSTLAFVLRFLFPFSLQPFPSHITSSNIAIFNRLTWQNCAGKICKFLKKVSAKSKTTAIDFALSFLSYGPVTRVVYN